MKEEDKRAVALNSLTSIGKEYVTLSDSTTIGKDVIKDLKKLMELELREKYKVNKTKWKVITHPNDKTIEELSKVYHVIDNKVDLKLVEKLKEKFKENEKKKEEKKKELNELKESNKTDTDKYKRVEKEFKELNKFFVIDMVTDTPISFNTIVNAIVKVGDVDEDFYCVPYIELNKDPKEIATILNDKKELDKIFREKQFKSFDDMVILDFYNEITKKLSDTKDYLRKTDPDIRQDIIDDLYNKLFALYDIKEYYFKDKVKDKDDIKEKFIKDKIRKNNNLSIGGDNNNDEVVGGIPNFDNIKSGIKKAVNSHVLEGTSKILKNTKIKPEDSVSKKVVRSVGKAALPVFAAAELALKDIPRATLKGVGKGVEKTRVGLYKGVRATLKATKNIIEAPVKVTEFVVEKAQEIQEKNKEKAEMFSEADKFLHIVTDNLKNKTKNVIDKELNIGLLKDLSASLNEESIYKKSIEDLIDIHDSISGINRDNLLEQEEEDAKEYIGKKKEASGDFILKAIDKYKNLKKSFVDKVNKDKDAVEKMLEEGAGDTFAFDITFGKIINSNNETYIKKLKNMNSFLYLLNNKKIGGAAPIYDSKKIKKDEGEQELSGNTPLYYYKKLNDNYSEIVNLYYKLVDDINGEECHTINKKEPAAAPTVVEAEAQAQATQAPTAQAQAQAAQAQVAEAAAEKPTQATQAEAAQAPTAQAEAQAAQAQVAEAEAAAAPPAQATQAAAPPAAEKAKAPTAQAEAAQAEEKKTKEDDKKDIDETGENKLNVLNEKIQLIENRIKLLNEIILKLPKELEKLYKIIKNIKGLPQATEYEDYIINILKDHKIELFEKDKDKHPIIKTLNNEKNEKEVELKKTKSIREEAKKAIEDKNAIKKANLLREFPRNIHAGGGDDNDVKDLKIELNLNKKKLKEIYIKLYNIIDYNKNNDKNLHNFIIELKNDVEYLENNNDAKKGSDKSVEVSHDKGIYEDIWYDYNLAVNKTNNKQDKWKNYLSYLTEGEKVYDRVIQNNLDPEIVLKINFRDKSIYIFLMFLIRTINIIALEFLIEYNLIKTLQYTIMLYGFMYLFIILLLVILVNYDSYKLRILFNYLNIHINSSNLLLQNVLFIIFIILVYILVKSDDFLKYFGDLFDFTNIYNNIYKFNESLNENSDINLTQNEKLKLLYRIDIISMIIFIFSAFLVLIL